MKNKTTDSKPLKEEDSITTQNVTNQFRKMMREAHEAQRKVLLIREADLNRWGNAEQKEFKKIFGIDGNAPISSDVMIKGAFSHKETKTAREIMQDGIIRIQIISAELKLEDFINETKSDKTFAAYVESEIQENYKIYIGKNFSPKKITGPNSQASTLCHEMSHFAKHWSDPSLGGMGTKDLGPSGKPEETTAKKHLKYAQTLIDTQDEKIFTSSYNIEKYFEIELN